MSFDPFSINLPVTDIIPEVRRHLTNSNTLILNAPTGAGKSTLIPLALLQEPWLGNKKILMLEPRRLAARAVANRMSSLLGEETGETVGYRIRFENKVSERTKIEVLTEGILTRMLHEDNSLKQAGIVIFDEFHERSIYADIAMALCREAQQRLRPDLRILVMSATLDMPQLTKLLNAPMCQSKGKQYPVEVRYTGLQEESMLPELLARTVKKAIQENQGDVLAFLPGESEIKKCEEILKKELKGFAIHPLYGKLPQGKQYAALLPDKHGKRKVVLATSIAETSLTIEGITIVVDSGFTRSLKYDPRSGLSRLQTLKISKDSADQRAGRAGRLAPGICYRMWTEQIHESLQEHRIPEILEADLSSLILDMAEWGITDIDQLTWLTPPPTEAKLYASETLHQLNALEDGRITEHGRKIHGLACHPRLAHMLILAQEDNLTGLATDIAAILEEKDPLPREAGIDINDRIKALRRYRQENGQGKPLGKIEKVARSYRKLLNTEVDNSKIDVYETGVLLAHCYPERIAFARPGNNAQFQLANGKYASAHHKDSLAHEPWLAVATLDAREGLGKIYMASPLNPKDLAPLVKEKTVVKWDTEDGELTSNKTLSIGNIVLKSSPLPAPDRKHLMTAIIDAIRNEGKELLPFTEEVKQWQNRVLSLRKWRPSEGWPDVSTSTLLLTNKQWLSFYLKDIEFPQDLQKLDLLEILQKQLTPQQQVRLEELAPAFIITTVQELAIKYTASGEAPVLKTGNKKVLESKRYFVNDGKVEVKVLD